MLFYPWRNEKTFINNINSYVDFNNAMIDEEKELFSSTIKRYNASQVNVLEEIELDLNRAMFEDVAPSTQHIDEFERILPVHEDSLKGFWIPTDKDKCADDDIDDFSRGISTSVERIAKIENLWEINEIINNVNMLNYKQRVIYDAIMKYLYDNRNNPESQLLINIDGGAGSGKSLILKLLYQSLTRFFNQQRGQCAENECVLRMAYTGHAAFLIGGTTIHHAFGFRPNCKTQDGIAESSKCRLQNAWENVKVILIDEISLVGSNFLLKISEQLKMIFPNNLRPFSGIHIITFGDFYQLKPVFDQWIFEDNDEIFGGNLWHEHFKHYELTQIMRQNDDLEFAQMLNRIRVGKFTDEDVKTLQSRSTNRGYEICPEGTPILCGRNVKVKEINNMIFEASEGDNCELVSEDCVIDPLIRQDRNDILKNLSLDHTKTGQLNKIVQVRVGLRWFS